jgi:hypothetical protein
MKRTKSLRALTPLAVIIMLAVSAIAQQPHKNIDSHGKNSERAIRQSGPAGQRADRRGYTPLIKGRSFNSVIEGRITGLGNDLITIKTSRGARHDLVLDDQTTVLNSGELVSIATLADIALSASDLRVSDTVEIVTERVGQQQVARIITRIASSGAQVAKR